MYDPFTDSTRPDPGDLPPMNGIGTASLVVSLVAFAFLWVPMLYLVTWPVAVVGMVLGAVGLNRARTGLATNRSTAAGGFFGGLGALIVMVLAVAISLSRGPLEIL